MKTAIVHYRLLNVCGGKKIIEVLLEMFPDADIYTHVCDPKAISQRHREPLINLTLISGSLLFFSFSCGKLRKMNNNVALIYSRLNKSALP